MSGMSPRPGHTPIHFYVFEDAKSLHILLSYATSEQLGRLQFNVPNLVAQVHIDAVSLPVPGNLRKAAKMKKAVSFKDPLWSQIPQPHLQSLAPSLQQQHEEDSGDINLQGPSQGPFPYLAYPYHQLLNLAQVSPKSP